MQKVSLLISRVKAIVNIRNCTIAILIIVGLSIIFAIVIIMVPEPFQRIFPRARESIATLATAAMVFATLLLAYGTFRIIRSDRDRERRDRKERLLNEIIEGALDAAKSAISRQTREVHELWKTKLEYKFHRVKSEYIAEIAASSFEDLSPLTKDIITKLDEVIDVTTQCIEAKHHVINLLSNSEIKQLIESEERLAKSVEKLITEAAKIKTKDIS